MSHCEIDHPNCLGKPAPPGVEPDIPFRVVRSKFGNLPVYLDYKSGGSRILTIVRKIEGDVEVRREGEREERRCVCVFLSSCRLWKRC